MRLPLSHAHPLPYADLAFFAGWTPADLERMLQVAEVVEYEPGEIVTAQDALPLEFLVIVRGRAAVLVGEQRVGILSEGETIGEVAMLGGTLSPLTVVAQTSLKALLLAPREFNGLMTQAPSMGRRLAMQLAGRVREQIPALQATA